MNLQEKTDNIDKYNDSIDLINSIINAVINKKTIPDVEFNYLVNFLNCCIEREENNYVNPLPLQNLFDKYYIFCLNNNSNNSTISKIIERKKDLLNKVNEDEMIEEIQTSTPDTIDNLTKIDKTAFICTTIVLQGTIILSLILSLLAIVKK